MTDELNEILNLVLKDMYEKEYKNTKFSIDINPNNMT